VVSLDGTTTARTLVGETENLTVEVWNAPKHWLPRPRLLRQSCAFLKGLNPTVLLTYNWGATEWALANRMWLRLPHLHFEDGFGADESPTRQLRRRVLFRRLALGGSKTQIIVPSQQLYRLAIDVWRFNRSRVLHVPNGIDCDRFLAHPDSELAARVGRKPDEVIVGTVAALRPEKNLPRLIRAFAALPSLTATRLVIAGDGPVRPQLQALVREARLEDRVVFAGPVTGANQILGLFDLFALSSDTEQMPYSVLEAMAAGLPIVATDVGDIRIMVAEENRNLIVSCTDETGFVKALGALLHNGDLRSRLGRLNAERARQEYDVSAMVARYDKLIRSSADVRT
jgi:glycosyltransferase involved in cell wall biosynthesis